MSIDSDLTLLQLAARVDPVLRDAVSRLDAENARLREQAEALAGALQDLLDEQNGPPLLRAAESWQAARDKSAAALAAYRTQEAGQ